MFSSRLRALPWRPLTLLLAGLVGILFLRRPDAFLRPQFWAEDFGFLIDAEQYGLASLGMPQAGYLHTLPRLIALAAIWLDPVLQPVWFLAVAVAVTVGVGASLQSSRLDLPHKFLLPLALVAVPHTGEVFFNPTNLQWIVALGILGTALKEDPRSGSDWCVDLGFLIVGGLTGPMGLFAWPLFLLRAWRRRSRASWVALLAATATAVIQFALVVGLERESSAPIAATGLAANLAFHLFGGTFLGVWATPELPKLLAVQAATPAVAVAGAAIVTAGRYRSALVSALAFAVLVLAAAVFQKRPDLWPYGEVAPADRYFYIPRIVLLWILAVGAAASTVRGVRAGAMALLALALIVNAPRFRLPPQPDFGWYAACARIRAGEATVVTVAPGWKFHYQRGSPASRHLSRRESAALGEK